MGKTAVLLSFPGRLKAIEPSAWEAPNCRLFGHKDKDWRPTRDRLMQEAASGPYAEYHYNLTALVRHLAMDVPDMQCISVTEKPNHVEEDATARYMLYRKDYDKEFGLPKHTIRMYRHNEGGYTSNRFIGIHDEPFGLQMHDRKGGNSWNVSSFDWVTLIEMGITTIYIAGEIAKASFLYPDLLSITDELDIAGIAVMGIRGCLYQPNPPADSKDCSPRLASLLYISQVAPHDIRHNIREN